MSSRHTRSNPQEDLISLTNEELTSLERTNRQQKSINNGRLWHSRTNGRIYATDARVTANNRSAATGCTAGTTCPNWKIDDLAAKVDLLLKNNQNQIYVMEETNLEPGTTDAAAETETSEEDQQEYA
ncbi:hypothetical protein F2Q69_00036033 [Brassica cretica]|uniref:Uncharacterized protein n=1 Tax=Brassica cretica TaxID=69181 RepID=A0A8S9SVU8_BRACR|nr:hypothetical protein F2Q69_00036033 [Brassica cretica]